MEKEQNIFTIEFPGDLEYIPAVRKFVADILHANNFDPKFSYRSEIIIDEICNNAVNFGCKSDEATVTLHCTVKDDQVEYVVKDEGGSQTNITNLKKAIEKKAQRYDATPPELTPLEKQLGLEIVRTISDGVEFEIDEQNVTCVKILKKREIEHS